MLQNDTINIGGYYNPQPMMFANNLLAQTPNQNQAFYAPPQQPQFNNPIHYQNQPTFDGYNPEIANIAGRINGAMSFMQANQQEQLNLNGYARYGIDVPQINNGYYGGQNLYNPIFYTEYQKQAQEQYKAQMDSYFSIWKSISRSVNESLGREIDEAKLNYLYSFEQPQQVPQPMPEIKQEEIHVILEINGEVKINTREDTTYKEVMSARSRFETPFTRAQNYNALYMMTTRIGQPNAYQIDRVNRYNTIHNFFRSYIPEDADLYGFMKNSGAAYTELQIVDIIRNQRNLSQLYNSDQFKQLIAQNAKPGSYADKMRANPSAPIPEAMFTNYMESNIDDMEIKLPERLKSTQFERKQAFFDYICNKISEKKGQV